MEWENQPALDELLTEAENLDAGYLSVARVNPDRREEQVGSWRTGPTDELRAWLGDLASELPQATRLRIRLYRHGGKPVRGVVCRTPVPCPSCAELATAVQDQNHRLDEASDERDDALARIDELEVPLRAAVDLIPPVDLDTQPSFDGLSDNAGRVREITLTDSDRRTLDSLCPTRVPRRKRQRENVVFIDFSARRSGGGGSRTRVRSHPF